MQIFAERLEALRIEHELNKEQLAREIGVSAVAIGRWEKCQRIPNLENLRNLCIFFNVSADYLIGLE